MKIKVKVYSRSGSTNREAELCLGSGIVEFSDSFSHISALANLGERVEKVIEVIPEPVKKEEPKPVAVTPIRSEAPKKKKVKG